MSCRFRFKYWPVFYRVKRIGLLHSGMDELVQMGYSIPFVNYRVEWSSNSITWWSGWAVPDIERGYLSLEL